MQDIPRTNQSSFWYNDIDENPRHTDSSKDCGKIYWISPDLVKQPNQPLQIQYEYSKGE